jgi:hypothetical protein
MLAKFPTKGVSMFALGESLIETRVVFSRPIRRTAHHVDVGHHGGLLELVGLSAGPLGLARRNGLGTGVAISETGRLL